MKITKQLRWYDIPFMGNFTAKRVGFLFLFIGIGIMLMFTAVFRFNWLALLAYVLFVLLLADRTPTGRSMLLNLYGIIFRKPVKMVVTNHSTLNTIGHGIKFIETIDGVDAPAIGMIDGNVKLVYVVTSGINQWSTREDYIEQALGIKALYNIFDGSEGCSIIRKEDLDTGMLQLKEYFEYVENYEGEDLERMSKKRRSLLEVAGTNTVGSSTQQYFILTVKKKNAKRCVAALKKSMRICRPASYPVDIILAAQAFEGGLGIDVEKAEKEKQRQ